ncbi:MAG TPA: O-methyltransferase [Lacunisphaera sp.]
MKFDPAYHLRTNKQVERSLFIELLRRIAPHLGKTTDRYTYVGMGGPYLEDFAMVQAVMGCKKMISLDRYPHVIRRQKFNQPHCRIELLKKSTGRWVEQFNALKSKGPLIVWFDHSKDEWREQLKEVSDLLPKLPPMSILKISLTCHPNALKKGASGVVDRAEKLREIFPDMIDFTGDDTRDDTLYKTLKNIYAEVVGPIFADTPIMTFRPLAFYHYRDTTPMLTITGIVGPANKLQRMIQSAKLDRWSFATLDWRNDPLIVSIPDLGIRERMAIDRMLPDASAKKILRELRLALAEKREESLEIIEAYARFSKHTPLFIKAAI